MQLVFLGDIEVFISWYMIFHVSGFLWEILKPLFWRRINKFKDCKITQTQPWLNCLEYTQLMWSRLDKAGLKKGRLSFSFSSSKCVFKGLCTCIFILLFGELVNRSKDWAKKYLLFWAQAWCNCIERNYTGLWYHSLNLKPMILKIRRH